MRTLIARVFGGVRAGGTPDSPDAPNLPDVPDFPDKGTEIYMPDCKIVFSGPDRLSEIILKVDRLMASEKLYLDPSMSLTKLAMIIGSNRTYLSNAMAARSGFRNYMNNLRLGYFCGLVEEREKREASALRSDSEFSGVLMEPEVRLSGKELSVLAFESGFSDIRTFYKAVETSESENARRIRSEILVRQ